MSVDLGGDTKVVAEPKFTESSAGMLAEIYEKIVQKLLEECVHHYGARLVSFCLYGSVARGTMNYCSDIDFLIVAEPLPDGRMPRVREFDVVEKTMSDEVQRARKLGVYIDFSPIIKTPSEVRQGSLLLLEEGRILFDRNDFLKGYFAQWKLHLQELGARRIQRGEAWYWILKEPYTVGEEFEI